MYVCSLEHIHTRTRITERERERETERDRERKTKKQERGRDSQVRARKADLDEGLRDSHGLSVELRAVWGSGVWGVLG